MAANTALQMVAFISRYAPQEVSSAARALFSGPRREVFCALGAVCFELRAQMRLPQIVQLLLLGG
jgi:hypothetical protein